MIRRLLSTKIRSSSGVWTRTFCISSVIKTNDGRIVQHSDYQCLTDPFTQFITPEEHLERQKKLVTLVHRHFRGLNSAIIGHEVVNHPQKVSSLILVPASIKAYQADTQIPLIHLKQNSDFIYLTGFNTNHACNCVLAILGDSGAEEISELVVHSTTVLFAPVANGHQLIWEGKGIISSENQSKLDVISKEIKDINLLPNFIDECISRNDSRHIFTIKNGFKLGSNMEIKPGNKINSLKTAIKDISPFIDQLKVIKSDNEMKAMKRTGLIGANAHNETIKWSREQFDVNERKFNLPLINESQISAKFDYECRSNGANKVAYPSVCAGGQRSTVSVRAQQVR